MHALQLTCPCTRYNTQMLGNICVHGRDGPNNVHFLGIDVSVEALHLARSNLVKQCPELSAMNIEMVCAEYLEGLKQARARCPFNPLEWSTQPSCC